MQHHSFFRNYPLCTKGMSRASKFLEQYAIVLVGRDRISENKVVNRGIQTLIILADSKGIRDNLLMAVRSVHTK